VALCMWSRPCLWC